MTFRDTSADTTLDGANMATKEQIAKLMADDPATIAERLSGNYIYPGAISPMRTPPIEQEAGREIVRLRAEIDALNAQNAGLQEMLDLCNGTLDSRNRNIAEIIEVNKELQAENERLKADAERRTLSVAEQIAQAKEDNADLVHWECYDPQAWQEAMKQDEILRRTSGWAAKPFVERFAEVVKRVRAILPEASTPP